MVCETSTSTGLVLTFAIENNGTIGGSALDFDTFQVSQCKNPKIVNVAGTIYAIAYSGLLDSGFVTTLEIEIDGTISTAIIETFEFAPLIGLTPDLIHVDGTVYAVAYRGVDDDGFISTFDIAADGDIAAALIDTLEFNDTGCFNPIIINIYSDIFAISYQTTDSDGAITTLAIDIDGEIAASIIETYIFEAAACAWPSIIPVNGPCYAVAFQGPVDDGFVCTVTIANDGDITPSIIDSLEFNTDKAAYPHIIQIVGDVFAIAHQGVTNQGALKTIGIDTVLPVSRKRHLMMGML